MQGKYIYENKDIDVRIGKKKIRNVVKKTRKKRPNKMQDDKKNKK